MESLAELKAIIENAPGKAEYYDGDSDFIAFDGRRFFLWRKDLNGWQKINKTDLSPMRSLSDIKRIIELMECLQSVKQTAEDGDVLGCWDMMKINEALK